jgi:hypothetical protein
MYRFLLAILLTISTCVVVAHGTLVYQLTTTEFLMAEEETSEDKPLLKESKEGSEETIGFSLYQYRQAGAKKMCTSGVIKVLHYSKGFYNKPYNPPDVS